MAWWMLQSFIVSALLAAGVWALCRWKKLGPAAQHALWMVVLLKLLMPPLLAWPLTVTQPAVEHKANAANESGGAMGWIRSMMALEVVDKESGGREAGMAGGGGVNRGAVAGDATGAGRTSMGEPLPAIEAPRQAATIAQREVRPRAWGPPLRKFTSGIFAVWLAWGLVFLGLQFIRILRMAWKLRNAMHADPVLARQVEAAAKHLGMRPIRTLVVPGIESPCIWALFGPVLLWPEEMNRKRATAQTLTLILHEYAHVKRRDHWVGWLELMAGCMWWWNPIYWHVRRQLQENAELLCDGWVVETLPWERRAYAEALLTVCERANRRGWSSLPAPALGLTGAGRMSLEMRIRLVMKGHVALKLSKTGLAAIVMLAAVALPGWSPALRQAPIKLPFSMGKETTGITSPLNADGTPDYAGALNEKYGKGVTAENNGFALWLTEVSGTRQPDGANLAEAWDKMMASTGARPTPEGMQVWVDFSPYLANIKHMEEPNLYDLSMELPQARHEMWDEKDHPLLAEFLKSQEMPLERAAEAVARPQWWAPMAEGDGQPMYPILISQLGVARSVTEALCARATWRAKAGDFDGHLKDLKTIRLLAQHLTSGQTLSERLVGFVCVDLGNTAAATVIGSGKLTAPQCAALAREFEAFAPLGGFAEAMETERAFQLNVLARVATGNLDSLKNIDKEKLTGSTRLYDLLASVNRESVDWNLAMKEINHAFDRRAAVLNAAPLAEQKRLALDFDGELTQWSMEIGAPGSLLKMRDDEPRDIYSRRVAHVISTTLTPGATVRIVDFHQGMTSDMLRMLLAAAENNARTGNWLTNFSELESKSPRDPFSVEGKEPFHLVVSDKGARVYSVGPNGVDDGGERNAQKGFDDITIGAR